MRPSVKNYRDDEKQEDHDGKDEVEEDGVESASGSPDCQEQEKKLKDKKAKIVLKAQELNLRREEYINQLYEYDTHKVRSFCE